MKSSAKRKCLIAVTSLFPLFAWGCSTTDLRDAIYGGALDFFAGTTADVLTAMFPLAEAIAGG